MKKIVFIALIASLQPIFSQKYMFYLHGKIIENKGPRAVDSVNGYGAYKYYDILDSLKNHGFVVISEARAKNTDVKEYALKIKKQIDSLLKLGKNPKDITVIGASKGASIAMYVSTYLKNTSVNYVFMAACYESGPESDPEINFYGNILSIYEKSDQAGSCVDFKIKSQGISNYKEIAINTGLRHGFLYKPIPEWLNPAIRWANGDRK
jgi:hypothetical protein